MHDVSARLVKGGVAQVTLCRSVSPAEADLGAAWPEKGSATLSDGLSIISFAPGSVLIIKERDEPQAWLQALTGTAASRMAVVDQSGAFVLVELSGPAVTDLLSAGIFIDLDPGAFPIGAAAVTRCGHIGVTLWRSAEQAFMLAAPRSYLRSFRHWLETSAEMRGLRLNWDS